MIQKVHQLPSIFVLKKVVFMGSSNNFSSILHLEIQMFTMARIKKKIKCWETSLKTMKKMNWFFNLIILYICWSFWYIVCSLRFMKINECCWIFWIIHTHSDGRIETCKTDNPRCSFFFKVHLGFTLSKQLAKRQQSRLSQCWREQCGSFTQFVSNSRVLEFTQTLLLHFFYHHFYYSFQTFSFKIPQRWSVFHV